MRALSAVLLLFGTALAQQAAPPAAPAPAADKASQIQALLAQSDGLYKDRDAAGWEKRDQEILNQALALNPKDYGALWRMARHFFWLADGKPSGSEVKKNLGKIGWDWAEQALQVRDGLEARYYAALTCGAYGQGLGVLSALSEGIEGKFRAHLDKAIALDKSYDAAGPLNALGRYYFELPWPKYDGEESIRVLKEAIRVFPKNLRARVYLAETLLKEGEPQEARRLVDEVLAQKPGAYDAPEERRAQAMARALLPRIEKELE